MGAPTLLAVIKTALPVWDRLANRRKKMKKKIGLVLLLIAVTAGMAFAQKVKFSQKDDEQKDGGSTEKKGSISLVKPGATVTQVVYDSGKGGINVIYTSKTKTTGVKQEYAIYVLCDYTDGTSEEYCISLANKEKGKEYSDFLKTKGNHKSIEGVYLWVKSEAVATTSFSWKNFFNIKDKNWADNNFPPLKL